MAGFRFSLFLWLSIKASVLFAGYSSELDTSKIQTGDIIFLDLDCGDMCQAIIDVTKEQLGGGPDISHVGQIERDKDGGLFVYEVLPELGVRRTPWKKLIERLQYSRSKKPLKSRILVGRIREEAKRLALNGLAEIRAQIGKSYNELFREGKPYQDLLKENEDSFYCSQLLERAWSRANQSNSIFKLRRMTFGKPGSAGRLKWEEYFRTRGVQLPEGHWGISPLGIYHDGKGKIFDLLEWS